MDDIRIMIVDDEMIIARDIELILKRMGFFQIRIVNTSAEAIETARKFLPALILFDVNLEEERDGIVTASEILKFLYTRILFVTAHSNRSVIERAMAMRPVNYIIKPFDQDQIEVAVKMAINDGNKVPFGSLKVDYLGILSETERKIIKLIGDNKNTKEIAELLFLSPKTIENNRYNICKKLDLAPEKNSLIKWVFANKDLVDTID